MLLAIRVSMTDRPGALARLATALAASDGDIAAIEVIDRAAGTVVDDLVVEIRDADQTGLSRRLEDVPGGWRQPVGAPADG